MSEEELKKQFDLFTEAWRFFRKWAVQIPLSDEQWSQVIQETGEVREKYGNEESVRYLMIAVIERLDETERRIKQ